MSDYSQEQIIPLIIISTFFIVFHFYIQIAAVTDCVQNSKLTKNKKIWWIIFILLSNFVGACVYSIVNRKDQSSDVWDDDGRIIKGTPLNGIFLCLMFGYEIMTLVSLVGNTYPVMMAICLGLVVPAIWFRHIYLSRNKTIWYYIFPFIEIGLVLAGEYYGMLSDYRFSAVIVVATVINDYDSKFLKKYLFVPIILLIVTEIMKISNMGIVLSQDILAPLILKNLTVYALVIIVAYVAKKQLLLNNKLKKVMVELKETSQKLEEASIVEERSRIAREIHDTLGHTLTGAIVQLEAAKKLIDVDKDKAKEFIEKSQEITREGFTEVKRAIKALKPISIEENTLKEGLETLMNNTMAHCDCVIENNIDLPDSIEDQLKTDIYRVVQELITNSLRHGNAEKINVIIDFQNESLRVLVSDNGIGCSSFKEGYGLSGIKERLKKYDAKIDYQSRRNKGFTCLIYLTFKKKELQ